MQLPTHCIVEEDYKTKLKSLLIDHDCIIIFDTNIISLLYKLHSDARNQLIDWALFLKSDNRLKIPEWVCAVLTNHYKDDKINNYNSSSTSNIKTAIKFLNESYKQLSIYIDDSLLRNTQYTNRVDFLANLKSAISSIESISRAAKDKVDLSLVQNQISDLINGSTFCSDLNNIYKDIAPCQ